MIEIKIIKAEETYDIRKKILRDNIPLPYKFNGDLDNDTFHLGAFKNNKLIAVSSFMKVANDNFKGAQFQLRGMATLTEYQGLKAGKLMLEQACLILKNINIDVIWCNARLSAIYFYEKQGFVTFGPQFEIDLIGSHFTMYKNLRI